MSSVIVSPRRGETIQLPPAQFNALVKNYDIYLSPGGYASIGDGYAEPNPPAKLSDADEQLAKMMSYYDREEVKHYRRIMADTQRAVGHTDDHDPAPFIAARNADHRYNHCCGASQALYDYAKHTMTPARLFALNRRVAELTKEANQ